MYEWMNVYLYTAHITSCLKAVYKAIEWDRSSACEGASGFRYQSIFDLTHPPNPCMKCEMKLQIDHNSFSSSLFICHKKYMKRNEQKKSNYLDSHGEESQKKPAGL